MSENRITGKPYRFAPWTDNTLAPDSAWKEAAESPLVDVTCELWPDPSRLVDAGRVLLVTDLLRSKLFQAIDRSPNHWLLTTKYPARVAANIPGVWCGPDFPGDTPSSRRQTFAHKFRSNVTLLIPAQTQAELDQLAPELLKLSHLCPLGLDLRGPREEISLLSILCNFSEKYLPGDNPPPQRPIALIRLSPWEGEPCCCGHLKSLHHMHCNPHSATWWQPLASQPCGVRKPNFCDCGTYRPAFTTHLREQANAAGVEVMED